MLGTFTGGRCVIPRSGTIDRGPLDGINDEANKQGSLHLLCKHDEPRVATKLKQLREQQMDDTLKVARILERLEQDEGIVPVQRQRRWESLQARPLQPTSPASHLAFLAPQTWME